MTMTLNGIRVGLGTAYFGTFTSPDDSYRVMDQYASLGGRLLDTANSYASWHPNGKGGESESVIGNWLERNARADFTVMTKVGSQPIAAPDGRRRAEGLSAAAVHRAVDQSLARLKCGCIDILLAHHDDLSTPLLETWEAFSDLVSSGKVKKIGISNYTSPRIAELVQLVRKHALTPVDFVQMKYSLIEPVKGADLEKLVFIDGEMRETLARWLPHALIFAYSPLLSGTVFANTAKDEWPSEFDSPQNRKIVAALQLEAQALGVSTSAYVLKRIADQSMWPITTTGKPERLVDNLKLFSTGKA